MLGFAFFSSSDSRCVEAVEKVWKGNHENYAMSRANGIVSVVAHSWCAVSENGNRYVFWYGASTDSASPFDSSGELPYGFAAVEYDSEARTVRTVRDALGIQSVFYAQIPSGIIISTDQKSVLSAFEALGISWMPNPQAVFECATYKTVAPDEPIFSGIRSLEFWTERTFRFSGTSWEESGKRVLFPLRFEKNDEEAESESDGKFRNAFDRAVSDFPNDGSVAVLFTGGLDSTLVLDTLRRMGKSSVSAVTVVQKWKWKTDDLFAVDYCKKYAIAHEVIETDDPVFSKEFERTVGVLEEPDSVLPGLGINLLIAAERAKELGIRTLISGSYVEPLLGSNPSTLMSLKHLYFGGRPPVEHVFSSFDTDWKEYGVDYSKLAERIIPMGNSAWSQKMTTALFDVFFSEVGRFPFSYEFVFSEAFREKINQHRSVFPNYFYSEGETGTVYDALSYSDLVFRGNIRNNLLNQRIANSTGISIVPVFAHKELRDLFLSAPVERKFNPKKYPTTYSDNKYFLFRAMGRSIPEEVANRKKTEASVPFFAEWLLSENNSDFVTAALDDLRKLNVFSDAYFDQLVRFYRIKKVRRDFEFPVEFKGKSSAFLNALWKAVAIAIWYRRFLNWK